MIRKMRISWFPFKHSIRPFFPLKQYFFRNRWRLALGLMSLLAVDFLQLIIPIVIKQTVDLLTINEAGAAILIRQGLIIIVIAAVIATFRYIWRFLILGHSRFVERELRNRLYGHLQVLSLSFFQRTRTGDLMARSINDINAIRMATGMGLVAFTDGIVLGTAAVGFMLSIDVKLTLISLIPAPVVVLGTRLITKRMSRGFDRVQSAFSEMTERVRESFSGIRVIKSYNRGTWACERLSEKGEHYVRENMSLAKVLAFFFPMMALFTNAGLAVVVLVGGRLAIAGDITTGDFVAFIAYLNLLTWPMMAMGWVTNLIKRGSASMNRINRILEEVPEIRQPVEPAAVGPIRGRLEVRGLVFSFPGQGAPTLKGIDFVAEPGETVAIVGRVGSGKTTLLQSIPRLLDVPEGKIFLDGTDVRNIPLRLLRDAIGFVTQEVFLFSDTIRNNIVFGRSGVSDRELEESLDVAGIIDEVNGLEAGIDTLLGERGITLSGGQRQRLSVARAVLENPPLLILDDSLSMVDIHTEERILERLLETRRDKTTLMVSHRVSTIARADKILVLEAGLIAERGNHDSLLSKRGIYAALYEESLIEHGVAEGDGS